MDIFNHFQLTENISSSGQPVEAQFEQIADEGYEVIINLAMPEHEKSIANEGSIVTSLGMTYIHIPVPFDAPKAEHLAAFSGCMDTFKNKKVWVHCVINARVSAFLFCYLQTNRGFSVQASTTPILKQWWPKMEAVWKRFISSYAPSQL